jgi:hypothetical protein
VEFPTVLHLPGRHASAGPGSPSAHVARQGGMSGRCCAQLGPPPWRRQLLQAIGWQRRALWCGSLQVINHAKATGLGQGMALAQRHGHPQQPVGPATKAPAAAATKAHAAHVPVAQLTWGKPLDLASMENTNGPRTGVVSTAANALHTLPFSWGASSCLSSYGSSVTSVAGGASPSARIAMAMRRRRCR